MLWALKRSITQKLFPILCCKQAVKVRFPEATSSIHFQVVKRAKQAGFLSGFHAGISNHCDISIEIEQQSMLVFLCYSLCLFVLPYHYRYIISSFLRYDC